MDDKAKSVESRRKVLRSLGGAAGALGAASQAPESWTRPVVESVILPAHAQTSPGPTAEGTTPAAPTPPPATTTPTVYTVAGLCAHWGGSSNQDPATRNFNAYEVLLSPPDQGVMVEITAIDITGDVTCTQDGSGTIKTTGGDGTSNFGDGNIDNSECMDGLICEYLAGTTTVTVSVMINGVSAGDHVASGICSNTNEPTCNS